MFDDQIFSKKILGKIYKVPEKKFIIVSDDKLGQNYLIFISKIENKTIDTNDDNFDNYYLLSNLNLVNRVYNIYDYYLNQKYEVNINQQALERVRNNY